MTLSPLESEEMSLFSLCQIAKLVRLNPGHFGRQPAGRHTLFWACGVQQQGRSPAAAERPLFHHGCPFLPGGPLGELRFTETTE